MPKQQLREFRIRLFISHSFKSGFNFSRKGMIDPDFQIAAAFLRTTKKKMKNGANLARTNHCKLGYQ